MKVDIGPYRNRWISNVHDRHMNRKYGRFEWDDNKDWKDRAWERFEEALQWLYNKTINVVLDKRSSQKIKVRIDPHDTWSMDHTLAHIVTPMLKPLKNTKHGSPFVDDEDVPEHLRSTSAPPKKDEYDIDDNHHKRWEWVLDEMIWAFEQKTRDNWEGDYYRYDHVEPNKESENIGERFGMKLVWEDREGREAHQRRMTNGFKLFGKYYESLWT
jgi:hypothetical protein